MNHTNSMRVGQQIQIKAIATSLIIFEARMDISFIFNVKMLIELNCYLGPRNYVDY